MRNPAGVPNRYPATPGDPAVPRCSVTGGLAADRPHAASRTPSGPQANRKTPGPDGGRRRAGGRGVIPTPAPAISATCDPSLPRGGLFGFWETRLGVWELLAAGCEETVGLGLRDGALEVGPCLRAAVSGGRHWHLPCARQGGATCHCTPAHTHESPGSLRISSTPMSSRPSCTRAPRIMPATRGTSPWLGPPARSSTRNGIPCWDRRFGMPRSSGIYRRGWFREIRLSYQYSDQ